MSAKRSLKYVLSGVLALSAWAAHAGDAVELTVSQAGHTETIGFASLTDMFSFFNNTSNITARLPWYKTNQDSTAVMNNVGIVFNFSVTDTGNTVSMSVPSIGFDQTYSGERDASLRKLKEDIKNNYGAIQAKVASNTPNSLVAGNPNSIQTQMASSQFDMGFTSTASTIASPGNAGGSSTSASSASARSSGMAGLGLRFGRYSQGDKSIQTATLPISYSWKFDEDDERQQIFFAMPLTAGQVENAKIYSGQLALGIGIPLTREWAITPTVGYGLTGSMDLLQASQQANISVTSSYTLPLDDGYSLSIGNMAGFFSTFKLKLKDYQSDINLKNGIFRNGLLFAIPMGDASLFGEGLSMEFSVINTHFTGSQLYTEDMNEFGLTFGTDKRAKGLKSSLRVGVSVITARNSSGVTANVGYWF